VTPEQAQRQREYDEAMTIFVDCQPHLWRKIYENSIKEGFTKEEAMEILKAFIPTWRTNG